MRSRLAGRRAALSWSEIGIQSLTIAGMLGQPLPSPENGPQLRTATQMGDERERAPTTLARRPTVPFAVGGQTQRAKPELGSVVLPRILRFEKRRDSADPCVEAGDLCPRQRGGQCLPFPFWGGAMLFHAAGGATCVPSHAEGDKAGASDVLSRSRFCSKSSMSERR